MRWKVLLMVNVQINYLSKMDSKNDSLEQAEASRKRKRDEDDETDSKSDTESEVSAEEIPDDDNAVTELLKQEAAKIVGDSLPTTVVNGRTLRDRSKITAPTDMYWERFGKKNLQKLAVSEHKREMLDDIKAWKKEFVHEKPEFVWTSLSMKDTVETIEAFHNKVIQTFELELADDDEEESEVAEEEDDVSDDDDEEEDDASDDDSDISDDEEDSDDDDDEETDDDSEETETDD